MRVWLVTRPGYGDFDGMPDEIWTSRKLARDRARELNKPWAYRKSRKKYVYKVRSMEMNKCHNPN